MELIKGYECIIDYLPRRSNVIANVLSRKVTSFLAHLNTIYFHLLIELKMSNVQLSVDDSRALLSIRPSLID